MPPRRARYKEYFRNADCQIPESTLRSFNQVEVVGPAAEIVGFGEEDVERENDERNSDRSRSSLGSVRSSGGSPGSADEDDNMPEPPNSDNDSNESEAEGSEISDDSESNGDDAASNAGSHQGSVRDPNSDDEEAPDDGQEGEHDRAPRDPLYRGRDGADCPITYKEGSLLITAFALRFGLTDLAIENLLGLINCHMPSPAYGTFHDFKKGMPAPADNDLVVKNFYCPQDNCRVPISFEENEQIKACECRYVCDKKLLDKAQSYFLSLSLTKQLKSLLKEDGVLRSLRWEERDKSDVISGQFYQSCVANNTIRVGRDLTIQFNTDGAAIFSTSTVSVWPLQVMINELPYSLRADSIILCGLWYGSKPNMNTFLKPFVDELTTLHRHGFELPGDPPRLIKVHAILCSVDTVARAPLQALHYHRGEASCSFCLHPGEEIEVGHGSARAMRGDLYPARSKEMHVRDTDTYNEILPRPKRFHINGVTGSARLLLLPTFNIIESFVPDYLHSLLLGVVKTFTEYWCTQANNPFHIGAEGTITEIDSVFLTIQPPREITRLPRTFTSRHKWRGHEWKNWLLYYSIPCLKAVNFPDKYLNHWFLLVYSMSCFLSDHVTPEKYEKGTQALRKFVLTIEQVYGSPVLMKYNTHLLLHYPKSVKDFGALWAWSTFKYEHYNGFLGKMFKSSQSAQLQICKNYVRLQGIREQTFQVLQDINCPACVKKVLEDFDTGRMTQHVFAANVNLKMLGVPHSRQLTVVELNRVQNLLNVLIIDNVKFYKRFIYKHVLYHTKDSNLKKRFNCVAKTTDNQYIMINSAIKVETDEPIPRSMIVMLGSNLQPTGDVLCNDRDLRISSKKVLTVVRVTDECVALLPQELERKCVLTFYPGDEHKRCCVPLVNLIERD